MAKGLDLNWKGSPTAGLRHHKHLCASCNFTWRVEPYCRRRVNQ